MRIETWPVPNDVKANYTRYAGFVGRSLVPHKLNPDARTLCLDREVEWFTRIDNIGDGVNFCRRCG